MNLDDLADGFDVARLRFPVPEKARWQPLRAGIQNLWEYDDQRFVFHKGRLLLRGRNESGKTKALEVLFPFLLDAELSPGRLDPFGSAARKMAWNLLHDEGTESHRVGYVWLELGRLDDGVPAYLTLGAGLKAFRADGRVDPWYFVTSLRVDDGLALLDASRVPVSKGRLVEAIGETGRVFERGAAYRRELNQRLFGMVDEQYTALLETLLRLRRPQLAKGLDPASLSRILTASLPPLDGAIIGTLAEGFERLDRHRKEREELRETAAAVRGFLRDYRRYVQAVSRARSLSLTSAESTYHRAAEALREAQKALERAEAERGELAARESALEEEREGLEERVVTLKASDAYRAVEALDAADREARQAHAHARSADARAQEDRAEVQAREVEVAEAEAALSTARASLERGRALAEGRAREAALLGEHGGLAGAIEAGDVPTAKEALAAVRHARERALEELGRAAARLAEAESTAALHERIRVEREETVRGCDARAALAKSQLEKARRAFDEAVEVWLGAATALAPTAMEQGELLEAEPEARRDLAARLARLRDEALRADENAAALALERVRHEHAARTKERDELLQATHAPPPAPSWRRTRPDAGGAPLYLLCEPLHEEGAGALEGALEAAGLLDAWVTPDGALLDEDTFDVALVPSPLSGPTLADVLRPTPAAGVPEAAIRRVLTSIRYLAPGATAEGTGEPFVAHDGRFGIGPIQGALRKARPLHLGATARERERQRRLALLADEIARLDAQAQERAGALEAARARRRRLEEELARFPSRAPIDKARHHLEATEHQLVQARADLDEARRNLEQAAARADQARAARDAIAARHGLSAWASDVQELRAATSRFVEAVVEWIAHASAAIDRERSLSHARDRLAHTRARAARSAAEASEAGLRAERAAERLRALKDAAGAAPEKVLFEVHAAEERLVSVKTGLKETRARAEAQGRLVGESAERARAREAELSAAEQARRETLEGFRELATSGALEPLEIAVPEGGLTTLTEALALARALNADTERVNASPEACERAENQTVQRWNELQRVLPPELQAFGERRAGLWQYRALHRGRTLGLAALSTELGEELAERERLLDEEERGLFESFLEGEAHEHVRSRLRAAHERVRRMSRELEARPTPSGTRLRLEWNVTEEAPPGARDAIELWLKSASLLADVQREALARFLRTRLDAARDQEATESLRDRLVAALDYRPWFEFQIQVRAPNGDWKKLTKRVHGAGSGGQKAMLLHLPLFAAVAAFYDSAKETAPRLFALDEAFAGIDRKARGELMGLVAAFDLDFVMTSFEEWGFYRELDGIATYHLSREPGTPGVLTEWFLWDGAQRIEVGF